MCDALHPYPDKQSIDEDEINIYDEESDADDEPALRLTDADNAALKLFCEKTGATTQTRTWAHEMLDF